MSETDTVDFLALVVTKVEDAYREGTGCTFDATEVAVLSGLLRRLLIELTR